MAAPPMETAVLWPRPAEVRAFEISVVMPPLRDITPTGPGTYALRVSSAGPPTPPILDLPGEMMPRQLGPVSRAPGVGAGGAGPAAALTRGDLAHAIVYRHAVDVAAAAAGGDAADDLGAVVQAL